MLPWNSTLLHADATYADIADDWGLWRHNLAPEGECSWTVGHLMDEDAFYQASIEEKVKLLVQEWGPE